jgi:hypothetical protein
VNGLVLSLLSVAGILLLASGLGRAVVPAFVPPGRGRTLESWGWSIAVGSGLLAAHVPIALAVQIPPGWAPFLALALGCAALARWARLPESPDWGRPESISWPLVIVLLSVTAAGIGMYAVRAISEPMWSNDFLAVWGLKGKTIFFDAEIPQRLFRWPELEFSNPSYPIGLPLAYAAVAFLRSGWDDQSMALLFPFFQLGTLLVLVGWLQSRKVRLVVAVAAAAFIANLGTLYSAWLTGMAEVPASFAFLLVGVALWDFADDTDRGSVRRLALASLLAAATKNEGVFLVGTAGLLLLIAAFRRRERRLWVGAMAVLIAGGGTVLLHKLVLGSHPIRGLDPSLLWRSGLGARIEETLREEWTQLVRPIWPGLAALAGLLALGGRRAIANPIAALVAMSAATYLALPVLCPFGPAWLVHWTVGRITTSLAPLLGAGIAMAWRNSEGTASGSEPV